MGEGHEPLRRGGEPDLCHRGTVLAAAGEMREEPLQRDGRLPSGKRGAGPMGGAAVGLSRMRVP